MRDPLLYHLQINTGVVHLAEAVEMVVRLVEGRGATTSTAPSPGGRVAG